MIKNIIFDLGGVLIDWDPKYVYRTIFETEEAVDHFLDNVCTFDWNEKQDGGRTIKEANSILIDRFPEYEQEILAFYGRWEEMLGGAIDGSVNLLHQIKKSNNYPLYALTNWSAETFPIALEKYEFLHWFDGVLVSGEEKLKKPDPKIYQLIIERYNLEPEATLFIDDNLRNVKAASGEGLQTIHFENPFQLEKELHTHKINF